MLRARMSASENLCSQPRCEQGSWQSLGLPRVRVCMCVCAHACVCSTLAGRRGACCRVSMRLWVTTAHRQSPAPSGPPQPASLFSGSQMSPRCFSLPAWLRAVCVCIYFGQPTK